MNLIRSLRRYFQRLANLGARPTPPSEPHIIAQGWDRYAEEWEPEKFPVLPGHRIAHLGDEWTGEDPQRAGANYGLDEATLADFDRYLKANLLDPYLPPYADAGLEIGPGGGRLTALLIPRTATLHLAEPSKAMLRHLRRRFGDAPSLRYYLTDGMALPPLPLASLDYAIALDVFVHFEPRLVYWYLRQIAPLLKPGGTGVIHYANILTPIGWRQFEAELPYNVRHRAHFAAFGAMCPQLMARFLEALNLHVVSADTSAIPRDAVAVFRKPGEEINRES